MFTCGQHPALHVCFSPLCTYWPFHCSHPVVAYTGVTDSESKLKTPVGIKGHCFIRIIHSNTINLALLWGKWKGLRQGEGRSKGFSIYSLSPIWIFFFPNNFIDMTGSLKQRKGKEWEGVSFYIHKVGVTSLFWI